ncbi:MAG TPA: methyltransferase domain-containing protein [Candidatus Thermoplasmatota archaeon]|nr:methyltransferase domain-containing protein [Candidatus Thermoplasmatota archaeon]
MGRGPEPQDVARARREAIRALPQETAWAAPLRRRYVEEVARTGVGFADNLRNPYAWVVYVYYTGLLQRLLPDKRARIVDWGGLYGHVTALLRERGYEDTSNYLLFLPDRYADFERTFALPTLYGKEPNALALPDASVDCFISSGVLEHVREDGVGREDLVLKEVRRVLKPGGILAVWHLPTTLAAADLWGKLRGRWYHRYRYGERQVRRLVADAGLDLVHLERHGGSVPGTALRVAGAPPARQLASDLAWGKVPVARLTAQNFALIARRSTDA